ncbi:FAD-dependent oxidoreductase [Mycobacterium seoulense]|uniref:FAD-dependent oxidoreductase n=1 Tax=Mycobacterium seoulense TaxID=386911 RepID=UPI003CF3EA68
MDGTIGTANQLGLPEAVDVAVVGSGAAGLAAALSAAVAGRSVLIAESQPLIGGTTAISGGAAWVPNHGLSYRQLAASDSAEDARRYLLGEGRDAVLDHGLVEAFLDGAPKTARFIEAHTYLSWLPTIWPDYHSEIAGASNVRSLLPGLFPSDLLGTSASMVRSPAGTLRTNPMPAWMLDRLPGIWIAGHALVGALLEACLRQGVAVRTCAPAARLVEGDSGVSGLVISSDREFRSVAVRRGVILASGGFEGSDEFTDKYLDGSFGAQISPAGHDGIALTMAAEVNASLSATEAAWWMPAVHVPGDESDSQPTSRILLGERGLPHTIMVNRDGERFANEARPYADIGAIMRRVDPGTGVMPNAVAWMLFDDYYWRRYGFFDWPPGSEPPSFLVRAHSLDELARRCGIDADGLTRTVAAFNPLARQGRDPQFNRGGTTYERFFGDYHPRLGRLAPLSRFPSATAQVHRVAAAAAGPVVAPLAARVARRREPDRLRERAVPLLAKYLRAYLKSPASSVLGPIDSPPYYAVRVDASALATVGGPRTDAHARVLDEGGAVIPGLYAAGNAGGAATGGFYGGAGCTISLALTFGHLAGRHAASRSADGADRQPV